MTTDFKCLCCLNCLFLFNQLKFEKKKTLKGLVAFERVCFSKCFLGKEKTFKGIVDSNGWFTLSQCFSNQCKGSEV